MTTSAAANSLFSDVPHTPGAPKRDPILIADDVVRRFGGLTAVDVEHLEIQRGAITALIGPNGAGKTTFFNLLTGFDRPDAGRWTFHGHQVSGQPPFRIARAGLVRTFQLTKALTRLSVIENMRLGATDQTGERAWRAVLPWLWNKQERALTERADELLARFKLDHMRDEYAGELSGGQRKLLEMARALMAEPTMVMLDEPMAGVNPALTQSLLEHVKDLRNLGMTVLFVEHDMDMVRDISDWVVVMAEGRVVSEGPPDAVMSDPAVIDAYLGTHHDAPLTEAEEERQLAEIESSLYPDEPTPESSSQGSGDAAGSDDVDHSDEADAAASAGDADNADDAEEADDSDHAQQQTDSTRTQEMKASEASTRGEAR
ncbi:ABC transporter ATP-binding protein [Phytoactinopolyspora halotolerans]|uniref:ABC transporter ATP-binding protein n=1 Tax=Phytoactinopolyspora halotolerans TaxID=1981512 RepID=A0A6L9SC16_9ACTN|nr:ABC transporter ATP-binding protein [Phytoactinopolyspora halotolerans]NEE02214.1 ABC transporter ATP-binding protein [Phytoactinopolyspora halotolerans]